MRKIISIMLCLASLSSIAQFDSSLGRNYLRPAKPTNTDLAKLSSSTLILANQGNAKAMYKAATVYLNNEMYKEAFGWFKRAAENGYARAWFNLGLLFKQGNGTEMDYVQAYDCFVRAAEKNVSEGEYALGYMLFKGLGCQQNYNEAFRLFNKDVNKNNCNSLGKMYFLGICWRNGYGTPQNLDSAKYWLSKSASLGYQFSDDELMMEEPEYAGNAIEMLEKINSNVKSCGADFPLNQFTSIKHSLPASEIEGEYQGYLIKYDWSGKNIIGVEKLSLIISCNNNVISGLWEESQKNISIPLNANLTKGGLVFSNMQYSKKDHYSPLVSVLFDFKKAQLQRYVIGDSVFLMGSLELYSPDRKEPEKPIQISVVRTKGSSNISNISFTDAEGNKEEQSSLKIYPNPFTERTNIEFSIADRGLVSVQIITIDGKVIYSTSSEILEKGSYVLPIAPSISAGTYFVRVLMGNRVKSTKLIKL